MAKTDQAHKMDMLGAYPIKDWKSCPERIRKDVSYDPALKSPTPAGLQDRFDNGNRFEEDLGKTFAAIHASKPDAWTYFVNSTEDLAADARKAIQVGEEAKLSKAKLNVLRENYKALTVTSIKETKQAMRRGDHVIWNGRLAWETGGILGIPDLLVREDWSDAASKPYSYLPVDIKDHKAFQGTSRSREYQVSALVDPDPAKLDKLLAPGIPQLTDSMQLCHYWYLLKSTRHHGKRRGGIIGREGVIVWRNLDETFYGRGTKKSAFEIYDYSLAGTKEAIRHEKSRLINPALIPLSGPELQTGCGECRWKDICHEELVQSNHITLLQGITPDRAKAHYEAGITKIHDLAELDRRTALLVDAGVDVVNLTHQAHENALPAKEPVTNFVANANEVTILHELQVVTAGDVRALDRRTAGYTGTGVQRLSDAIDLARVKVMQKVYRARSVEYVEIPRGAVEWDVDIEDAPSGDGENLCYLIGVRETIRSKGQIKYQFIPFVDWSNTANGEADVFARFWQALAAKREWATNNHVGAFRAYYYTEHETRFFRHLTDKYAGHPGIPSVEELDAFLTSPDWIDLHAIFKKNLIFFTENLTLKSLAKYVVRFGWRDEQPGGANSVAWYNDAIAAKAQANQLTLEGDTEAALEQEEKFVAGTTRILEYNEDDVIATWKLRDWVSSLGEAQKPGKKLPSVADLDAHFDAKRRSHRRV